MTKSLTVTIALILMPFVCLGQGGNHRPRVASSLIGTTWKTQQFYQGKWIDQPISPCTFRDGGEMECPNAGGNLYLAWKQVGNSIVINSQYWTVKATMRGNQMSGFMKDTKGSHPAQGWRAQKQ